MDVHRHLGLAGMLVLLLSAVSCSDGGGGGEPDLKYVADLEDEDPLCEMRVEYFDRNGDRRILHDQLPPWSYDFHQDDGARLFLSVEPECGRARAELYIEGHRVAHDANTFRAEIDGYLRIDSAGNAWFDPS